jgi:L-glyceraldehyde 3-phosphate reductase
MARNATLKREVLTPELLEKLRSLNSQAASSGQTLAELAISWILEQQGVTSVIVGASSVSQLATNLKAVAVN